MNLQDNKKWYTRIFCKTLKFLFVFGVIFLSINFYWLFYAQIWPGLSWVYNKYYSDEEFLQKDNIQWLANNFRKYWNQTFLEDCNLWLGFWMNKEEKDEVNGRFFMLNNKVCTRVNEPVAINHEMVHYNIWNIGFFDKLSLSRKSHELQQRVDFVVENYDADDFESVDDSYFYSLLEDRIYENSNMEKYEFYDWLDNFFLGYVGNEEYLAYSVGWFVNIENNKLQLEALYLEDDELRKIYNLYNDIFYDYFLE